MNLILSDCPLCLELAPQDTLIDLFSLNIHHCVGCFQYWVKTPGKCVICDDAVHVYPCIAKNQHLIIVSQMKFGSFNTIMKTMLERTLPIQQPFIRLHRRETHHVLRDVKNKKATLIIYGTYDEEEKQIFRKLIQRNEYNMNFDSSQILFVETSQLSETIPNNMLKFFKIMRIVIS